MKSYQEQYSEILLKLINEPQKISGSRVGRVRSRFVEQIRVDLREEFPLMDLKKIKFSNVLHELLWFVKGDTNIKYLIENGCKIWNGDAFRYYKDKFAKYHSNKLDEEAFLEKVLEQDTLLYPNENVNHPYDKYSTYKFGDLEKIYSFQWRNFNGQTDQIMNCINTLKTNPDDRRMIVTAHNPTDLENGEVGLPSCHNYFQFYTQPRGAAGKRYISIFVNIRSNDWFLGQPYNMASYSILLMMIAQLVNMEPKEVVINAVDAHLYEEHLEAAEIFLKRYQEVKDRDTFCQSKLIINPNVDHIDNFTENDFELKNYNPQSFIKAKLLT